MPGDKAAKRTVILIIGTLLLSLTLSYCGNGEKKPLERIKAENGDGSKVNANLRMDTAVKSKILESADPQVTISFSKAEIDIKSGGKQYIVVSNAIAIRNLELPDSRHILVKVGGEFFVDDKLNVIPEGKWDGKKEGATHTLSGKVVMFNYEFNSDPSNHLKFKMTQNGYLYISGKGSVKDLTTGKIITF